MSLVESSVLNSFQYGLVSPESVDRPVTPVLPALVPRVSVPTLDYSGEDARRASRRVGSVTPIPPDTLWACVGSLRGRDILSSF